jgi:hypothetical protein
MSENCYFQVTKIGIVDSKQLFDGYFCSTLLLSIMNKLNKHSPFEFNAKL